MKREHAMLRIKYVELGSNGVRARRVARLPPPTTALRHADGAARSVSEAAHYSSSASTTMTKAVENYHEWLCRLSQDSVGSRGRAP